MTLKRKPKKRRIPNPLKAGQTGKSAVSKRPLVDKEHRRRVESLPCMLCHRPADDSHHIRECFPRTMGRRKGDDWVVPLCRTHHNELHGHSRVFWQTLQIDPMDIARALYAETLAIRAEDGTASKSA